jgi:Uma2 family endonuclease
LRGAELNAGREVYDRSSLVGDFLVMLADQSPEDFERYAPEDQFCEYINGIVYMPSPVSDRHQKQVFFLGYLLDTLDCEHETGDLLLGPALLRLGEQYKPEPDIFGRPPGGQEGPKAVLVIEVLSPSNRELDLGTKWPVYREAGIPEIWFVDDKERVVLADRKVGDAYQTERISEGILTSTSIPGFWVDVSWLWADPLPNRRRCAERVLAGPPA